MGRTVKQLVYGGFFLVLLAAFFALFYAAFLRPAPGCFNGREDAGEEGVDCGGVCAAVCTPADFRPITVDGAISAFRPTPRGVAVLARIQNPNLTLGARMFSYTFTVKAGDGSVIGTIPGSSFIHAGEVKYLVGVASVPDAPSVRAVSLALGDPAWVPAGRMPKPGPLGVQNLVAERDDVLLRVRVAGRVVNRGTADADSAEIVAILKNGNGTPVGAVRSVIDRIPAGESREFALLYPPLADIVLERTEVLVSAKQP